MELDGGIEKIIRNEDQYILVLYPIGESKCLELYDGLKQLSTGHSQSGIQRQKCKDEPDDHKSQMAPIQNLEWNWNCYASDWEITPPIHKTLLKGKMVVLRCIRRGVAPGVENPL
ncbi:hypothetical protein T05_2927 [Trichinella murrelli]|uniref:Uncharacterized protein n=1 Tax=Trichinella murrelli TaxID=144512 RepID=A0A0V0TCM4_9BILA|nr:hypothetical protein T05_2927 [Trichinella murrelli]